MYMSCITMKSWSYYFLRCPCPGYILGEMKLFKFLHCEPMIGGQMTNWSCHATKILLWSLRLGVQMARLLGAIGTHIIKYIHIYTKLEINFTKFLHCEPMIGGRMTNWSSHATKILLWLLRLDVRGHSVGIIDRFLPRWFHRGKRCHWWP